MADAIGQVVAGGLLQLAEQGPVVVVVVLDDLERPLTAQHVAPHQLTIDPVGDLVVSGVAQRLDGLAELDVGRSRQLMERVEVAAGAIAGLQSLGQLPERIDRVITHPARGRPSGQVVRRHVGHGPRPRGLVL